MLTVEQRGRVRVVLVRARNPNNIGAVARAMHDFGFGDLCLVNDYKVPLEAARSAIDASSVLATATSYGSVAEAVAECSLVIGTTAIGERDLRHPVFALADAAPQVLEAIRNEEGARVALLFGSEKTGLSNEELSHCHWLLTIPMHFAEGADRHASMNLGQAAAVCLYELVRRSADVPELLERATARATLPATAEENERMAALLGDVLEPAEYRRHHPANSDESQLRRMVLRMGLDRTDAPVWMGMLRQMLWKMRQ